MKFTHCIYHVCVFIAPSLTQFKCAWCCPSWQPWFQGGMKKVRLIRWLSKIRWTCQNSNPAKDETFFLLQKRPDKLSRPTFTGSFFLKEQQSGHKADYPLSSISRLTRSGALQPSWRAEINFTGLPTPSERYILSVETLKVDLNKVSISALSC